MTTSLRTGQAAPPEVDRFLAVLEPADLEALLTTIEFAHTPIEVWTVAAVLGYTGSYGVLVDWARSLNPIEDRRRKLASEAASLAEDIQTARRAIELEELDPDKGLGRIVALSKELRGHLVEVDRMSRMIDRRGLVLAGADRTMRELRAIFTGNDEVQVALEQAFRAVWAVLAEES